MLHVPAASCRRSKRTDLMTRVAKETNRRKEKKRLSSLSRRAVLQRSQAWYSEATGTTGTCRQARHARGSVHRAANALSNMIQEGQHLRSCFTHRSWAIGVPPMCRKPSHCLDQVLFVALEAFPGVLRALAGGTRKQQLDSLEDEDKDASLPCPSKHLSTSSAHLACARWSKKAGRVLENKMQDHARIEPASAVARASCCRLEQGSARTRDGHGVRGLTAGIMTHRVACGVEAHGFREPLHHRPFP